MFAKGDRVVYVPIHAHGDPLHADCEHGVVSSVRGNTVFVKYDLVGARLSNAPKVVMRMETGDEPYTAQGTNAEDLVPEISIEAKALLS
jgi:hypothetical protein